MNIFPVTSHRSLDRHGHETPLTRRQFGRRELLKVCSALSLLLILFAWFDVSSIIEMLVSIDLFHILLALLFLLLQLGLSCARWIYIVGKQKLPLDRRNMVSIYGFSLIANLFFITSLAGMSVRVALLVRHGAELSKALASVTAERLAAIAGLAITGALGLAMAFPFFTEYLAAFSFTGLLIVALLCLVLGGLVAWAAHQKFISVRNFAVHLGTTFSSLNTISIVAAMSIAVVFAGFCGLAVLAKGMDLDIHPLFFIAVMPAVALISALPISLGGWGVREGAMVAGLSFFSIPGESALALSLIYGLSGVIVTILIGTLMAYSGKNGFAGEKN